MSSRRSSRKVNEPHALSASWRSEKRRRKPNPSGIPIEVPGTSESVVLDSSNGVDIVKPMEANQKLIIHVKFYRQLLCLAITFSIFSTIGFGSLDGFLGSNSLGIATRIFAGLVPLYFVLKTRIVASNGKLTISEMLHTERIEIPSISEIHVRAYPWNQRVLEITCEHAKRPALIKLSHFETNAGAKVTSYISAWNRRLHLHENAAK